MRKRSDSVALDIIKGIIKAIIIIPTMLIVFIIIYLAISQNKFKSAKTRISDEGLRIVTDYGTCSLGSSWEYQIYGDDIIEHVSTDELSTGFFTGTSIKETYLFKPVSEGTTYVSVIGKRGGGYSSHHKLYTVTVDKDLDISYEECDVELLWELFPFYDGILTVGDKQFTLNQEEISGYMIGHYIDEPKPSADRLEGLPKLETNTDTCYFDVDSGIVYLFDEQGRPYLPIFQIDERILPYFKNYMNGYDGIKVYQ
jgi:hypothetical protein